MNTSDAYANQFTKEAIKARLIRHAVELWGVKKANLLDPFVRLLMEAFSTEVYRVSNETRNIESRLLDKLARMLTPNLLTSARPAHAVMQAIPLDARHLLHPHTRFSMLKKVQQNHTEHIRKTEIPLSFSPTRSWPLVRGRVAVIANGYQCSSIDATGFKQLSTRMDTPLPWGSCWLGFKLDEAVTDLSGIALYFDFGSYETSSWIYQLLPLCKVYYNDRPLDFEAGIGTEEPDSSDNAGNIFKAYDLIDKLHEDIEQHYSHKFLRLGHCPLEVPGDELPEPLATQLPPEKTNSIRKDRLTWLEIRFPVNYSYEVLNECSISINTFPVSNRNLRTHIYSYKGLNGILPMRTENHEHFLSVFKVTDSAAREYRETPDQRNADNRSGYYAVRYGGIERFDQRSAHDMVQYLLELTRDEVAAFSSLDQTFIRTALEDLARQIRLIQSKARQLDKYLDQSPAYIVIEPIDPDENIQVDYWVTQGNEANQLRSGTVLTCQNNQGIDGKGAFLLSESTGGRPALQAGERQDMFKFALTSRDRLVTLEDIKNYCRTELGDRLKDITFKRGISPSPHPKEGYIRTLEIHLRPSEAFDRDLQEWDHISATLLQKINRLSPEGSQYTLHIDFTRQEPGFMTT